MTPRIRKHLFSLVRVAVCVAALWLVARGVTLHDRIYLRGSADPLVGRIVERGEDFIVHDRSGQARAVLRADVDTDAAGAVSVEYGLYSTWRLSDKLMLLVALLIQLPVACLLGARLKWLLRAQQIDLTYGECIKLSYAGNFLNFAAPLGSNAGDVFKAYFVSLHTQRKTEAMTTIALDRALGLGTLVAVVALIAVASPPSSALAQFRTYTLIPLAVGIVGLILYRSAWVRRLAPVGRIVERLPGADHMRRIDQAGLALMSRKQILVVAILLTLALQLLAIGSYVLIAQAVGLRVGWGSVLDYFAYFYIGAVIQSLPGPPQGLGTVELAYRYFFAPFGSVSQILGMAFAIRVIVLVCALPGALVAMTGGYKPTRASEPAAEIEKENPLDLPAIR